MNNRIIEYNENRAMQYVVAIEHYGSITKAAQALYISQPSLSKYIRNLEERLGFQLFKHAGGKTIPTKEGQVFIHYAKQIGDIEHRMTNELTDMIYKNHGSLRLAIPHLRSAHLIPKIIPPTQEKYPDVKIEIYERHSEHLERMLIDGVVDFAILNTEVKSAGIHSEKLYEEEILLVVPQNHPSAHQGVLTENSRYPQIDIALFAEDKFILQPPEQRTRQIADVIFDMAAIKPNVLFTTRSIETAILTVANGCGICFAPESYIKHLRVDTPPTLFSLKYSQARVTLNLAYFYGLHMPDYITDFSSIIRKTIESFYDGEMF